MKKIHILSIRYFVGPFIVTFFISLFVLLMQFLWLYIDDLVGKGLEWFVIVKLIFYASLRLIPLALPLAILLSSIMTLGNLAENNELMAFKSAGISLLKILESLGILILIIAFIAFLFSNFVLPKTNLEFGSLLYDIRTKKPTLDLQEGVFYSGIDDYSIRVEKKDQESGMLYDVVIYDHSNKGASNIVIRAEKGDMRMTADNNWMVFKLYNGYRFEEVRNVRNSFRTFPHSRIKFREYTMRFDLSSFQFSRTSSELFKGNYIMLDMKELKMSTDSVQREILKMKDRTQSVLASFFYILRDTNLDRFEARPLELQSDVLIRNYEKEKRELILERALIYARNIAHLLESPANEYENHEKNSVRYQIEWHRKITLSVIILVFFMIGAPMGAIIRKGGLGMPTVVAILLFIVFHIIMITSEKLTKQYLFTPFVGMWFPLFVLTPLSIFLINKANKDSVIFNIETYLPKMKILKKILGFKEIKE
jgi:lipopolysaccharide export system permease protein